MSALVLLAIALMTALSHTGRALQSNAAPYGIVSFEFAGDLTTARAIIEGWGEAARVQAAFNLGLDYLYLLIYGSTLALACLWVGTRGSRLTLVWAERMAWVALAAAGLDAVENLALYQLLVGSFWPVWPVLAAGCAAVKFTAVGACVLFVLVGYGLTARRTV